MGNIIPFKHRLLPQQVKEILNLHFNEKVSQSELAKRYNVRRRIINYHCKKANKVSPLIKDYSINKTKTILIEDVIKLLETKSVLGISRDYGVERSTIYRLLVKNGITVKDESFARMKVLVNDLHSQYRLNIWARKVKKRDGWKCKLCGETKKLHAHHILPLRKCTLEQALDIENGITVCQSCHNKIEGTNYSV
jgi:predicted DNA-binding protein YlxM (UPF0122 family)/ribosomal protein L37AE/L43A